MGLKRVCGRDELVSGEMIGVSAGGRAVLLADVGGALRAYENRCPHKGVPLSDGALRGTTLTCTAHHWTYDVATGRGINPDSAHLVAVRCDVAEGDIWVDNGRAGATESARRAPDTPTAVTTALPVAAAAAAAASSPGALASGARTGPAASALRQGAPAGDARFGATAPATSTAGRVGPVLLAGVVTDAVIEAIKDTHANALIVDHGSYLRVLVPDRCVIRAADVRARLHAPFHIPVDLEPLMCSFKGLFTASDEEAVFSSKSRG
jgi:toluene monooxygenase system ferredoxin subunit